MKIQKNHIWQAEMYHKNSKVQEKAAMHLLNLLSLNGKEIVLDIGCGDGKNTDKIAALLDQGYVYGIDTSKEMINFAKNTFLSKRKNLDFFILNAEDLVFDVKFDIIFSSFALQWVVNIEAFFKKSYEHLVDSGRLACTIPLSISDELESALSVTLQQKKWNSYFRDFKPSYFLRNSSFYENLLPTYNFNFTYFETVHQEWIFSSVNELRMYILTWLPHLESLPKNLQGVFLNNLMDSYIKLAPPYSDGKIGLTFSKLDFVAEKRRT